MSLQRGSIASEYENTELKKLNSKKESNFARFIEKQNSAIKGAMSLFNATGSVRQSSYRVSPTKRAEKSREGLVDWLLHDQEYISRVRGHEHEQIDLNAYCMAVLEQLSLDGFEFNV